MQKIKILVIEDEASVAKVLASAITTAGYDFTVSHTGESGLQRALEYRPELILLDLGLPDMPGLKVLKSLRTWFEAPVLILTANDSDEDKVLALDTGADDYVTKPFSTSELLARIRVALRHFNRSEVLNKVIVGSFEFELDNRAAFIDGKIIKLSATELDILQVLIRNRGKVVTHRALLKEVWGPNSVEQLQYVRVYVSQLRKKLRSKSIEKELIRTELGIGYRFIAGE